MMKKLTNAVGLSVQSLAKMNSNCKLLFSSTAFGSFSQGMFLVVFNLYILQMGIPADILGIIVGSGPYAQALGSIPIGFIMEKIGFKKVFIIISLGTALARIAQISFTSVPIIILAGVSGGLAMAGDFVVRLPFLAVNTNPENHNEVYSFNSVLSSAAMALGALLGGILPGVLLPLANADLTLAYRYTLFGAGIIALIAVIPILKIKEKPFVQTKKISLSPYIWGIDAFTVKQASVSLFVGLSFGVVSLFMNVFFVFHLGTSLEFFGTTSALVIIPALMATIIAPIVAKIVGTVRTVTIFRWIAAIFLVVFSLISNPIIGAISFWIIRSVTGASQPLSFSFAMREAKEKAKTAASAWLNVTFWAGNGIAASFSGFYIVQANYQAPIIIAAGSILLAGLLNELFFHRMDARRHVMNMSDC
jgi:MFS family permease